MAKELTIPLSNRQLISLHDCYVDLLTTWVPEGDTEQLLFDHAMDMERDLKIKVAKDVNSPRLLLKTAEVRAMWMLWQMMEIAANAYQAVLIGDIMTRADKYLQDPKLKMAAAHNGYKNS